MQRRLVSAALFMWARPILSETLASKSSWASEENNCNLTGDMKKMTIVIVVMLVMAVFMPTQMPKTAVRQEDAHFQYAVYVNVDKPASGEGEMDDVKSVWLANERSGTVIKVCVTNPKAEALWNKMSGKDADGVSVALTQIAAADKAMIAPGDVNKVIVEGCPDGRNIWTYIIDPYQGTAIQLPSTEGVMSLDWEKKEIVAASYGYDDDGRYSVNKAYSLDGKFLREVGGKVRE